MNTPAPAINLPPTITPIRSLGRSSTVTPHRRCCPPHPHRHRGHSPRPSRTYPPISAAISGGRCITFDESCCLVLEVRLWDGSRSRRRPSCGTGLRRVSRCGRSAARWVVLRRRCGLMLWLRGGDVRSRLPIGADCGCRLRSGRRSRVESLLACRCGVLPAVWVESPSTVSREVAGNGGRIRYRAGVAHRASRRRAHRPKPAKLATSPRLRAVVEDKLALWWSPLQISGWLVEAYPDDEEMRVSHETIYQSLFIQGKGALRKELWRCLRTGQGGATPPGPSGVDEGPDP